MKDTKIEILATDSGFLMEVRAPKQEYSDRQTHCCTTINDLIDRLRLELLGESNERGTQEVSG